MVHSKSTPVHRFDPAQNTYFPCAPLPFRRKSHQLVSGLNGTVYALGGHVYMESCQHSQSRGDVSYSRHIPSEYFT